MLLVIGQLLSVYLVGDWTARVGYLVGDWAARVNVFFATFSQHKSLACFMPSINKMVY